MKIVALLLVFCLVFTGCSGPVKEVNAFIDAKDEIILEIGKKIEANPTETGVDEARKVFESKKDDLKAKSAVVREKNTGAYGDLTTKLLNSAASNDKMFDAIREKHSLNCKTNCSAAQEKISALEKDFKEAR